VIKQKPGSPRLDLSPRKPEWSFESRKYIGLFGKDLNQELAAYFGVKEGTAVMISKLTEGGPAAKAKLQIGDIIISIDGKRVGTIDEIIDYIQTKAQGSKVRLEIIRDKKTMTFDIEVAEEEIGGTLGSEGLQGFLESWQGYTDALQRELMNWNVEGAQGLRQSLKSLALKGNLRRI
jgi:hypothetical protein